MLEFLVKSTPDQTIGHVYEHAVLNFLHTALLDAGYVSRLNYILEGEAVYDGTVALRIESDAEGVAFIKSQLAKADQALASSSQVPALAIQQIEAEDKKQAHYDYDAVLVALHRICKEAWQNQDTVALLAKRPERKPAKLLDLRRPDEPFIQFAIDIRMKRNGYADDPAMLFIFDELAAVMHTHLYSAYVRKKLPVYWYTTKRSRTKTYARSTMMLNAAKSVSIAELEVARRSSEKPDNFDEHFFAYIQGFTAKNDYRLTNFQHELYRAYGVMINKAALKRALRRAPELFKASLYIGTRRISSTAKLDAKKTA